MKSKISIIIAILALALVSCVENDIEYNIDDAEYRLWELSAPVGTIRATLYDVMDKEMGEDFKGELSIINGVVCFKYTHIEKIEWTDEIGIDGFDSQTLDIAKWPPLFNLPDPVTIQGDQTYQISLTTGENSSNYVSKADFTAGTLNISANMPNSLTAWNILVTIPELTKDGVVFSRNLNTLTPSIVTNLDGYKLTADNKQLNLNCNYTVTGTTLSGDATIRCSFSDDIEVGYLSGYFGQMDYEKDMEMEFDFFDNLKIDGTVGLKDANFSVKVINSIGMDFLIETKKIGYINNDLVFTDLIKPPFNLLVPSAKEIDNNHTIEAGIASRSQDLDEIEFKPGNYPTGIIFEFSGLSNHNNSGEVENFIIKNNQDLAEAQLTFSAPLHIKVENYNRSDTVSFDYNDLVGNDEDKISNVEYVHITLVVDNGLPFDVELEAIAINESGSYESRIIHEEIFANQKKDNLIKIELNAEQLKQFSEQEVKHIVLNTLSRTQKNENDNYVQIKDDAYLEIDVRVRIKAEILSIILNQKEEE